MTPKFTHKAVDPLNTFYGRSGAQTSREIKEQYGSKLSDTMMQSLCGEGDQKPGYININGLEFNLFDGLERRETAERQIKEIKRILSSPVGSYLHDDLRLTLSAMAFRRENLLKELGDEYDAYFSMPRAEFLQNTSCVAILKKTIYDLAGEDESKYENLVEIATKRLESLGVNYVVQKRGEQEHHGSAGANNGSDLLVNPNDTKDEMMRQDIKNLYKLPQELSLLSESDQDQKEALLNQAYKTIDEVLKSENRHFKIVVINALKNFPDGGQKDRLLPKVYTVMENFLDNSLENLRIASGFAIINILVSLEFDHQKKDILLEKAYRIIVQTLESPMQDIMQLHVIHIILNLPDDESKCGALNKKKLIEQSYPVIEKMLNSENQRTRAETIDTLKEFPEGKEKTRLLSTVQKG